MSKQLLFSLSPWIKFTQAWKKTQFMVVKVDVHAWGKVILIILLTTKSSRMKKEGLYIQNKPYGWRNKKIRIRASIFANRKEMEEEKKKGRDVSFDISIKPSGWIMAIWVRWSRQYMSKFMLESSLRLKEGGCLKHMTWGECIQRRNSGDAAWVIVRSDCPSSAPTNYMATKYN